MSENRNQPVHSLPFPLIFFDRLFPFPFNNLFHSKTVKFTCIAGILFLFYTQPMRSQNHTLDSLQFLLNQVKNNDTLKANILNQIARSYLYDFNNLEKMKQNAALAIQLSNKAGYKKGLGYGFIYFGIYYYNQSNYDYALIYYNRSLKLLEDINDQKGMGSCYINIGSIYGTKGDYKNALAYMLKGAKIKEEANDKRGT
ncbi:MAG TPA: hypothetical protein VFM99_08110, partial [Chitinophagales bacterium]|nr:hypothetical protein [Chitinophagales bacterium]